MTRLVGERWSKGLILKVELLKYCQVTRERPNPGRIRKGEVKENRRRGTLSESDSSAASFQPADLQL